MTYRIFSYLLDTIFGCILLGMALYFIHEGKYVEAAVFGIWQEVLSVGLLLRRKSGDVFETTRSPSDHS